MLKDLPPLLDQQPTVSDEKLHWNVMLEEKNWPQNIVEMIEKDTNHKTDGFSPWSIPIFPFLSFLVATSAIRLKRAFQCFSLSNYLLMKPFLASLHCLLQLVHWRGWCSSAKQNQLLTPSSLRLLRLLHSAGKNDNLCLKHNWGRFLTSWPHTYLDDPTFCDHIWHPFPFLLRFLLPLYQLLERSNLESDWLKIRF